MAQRPGWSIFKRYGFFWVTLVLFLGSVAGHWMFAWRAYVHEQEEHASPVVVSDYVVETLRDTFENWQSEFLQLIWQVAGLALLFYIGSTQSKESEERQEAKLDLVLRAVDPDGDKKIQRLDKEYPRK